MRSCVVTKFLLYEALKAQAKAALRLAFRRRELDGDGSSAAGDCVNGGGGRGGVARAVRVQHVAAELHIFGQR